MSELSVRVEKAVAERRLADIRDLEAKILATQGSFTTENNEHIQTKHHFAEQVYGREFRIKAGTLVTGKMHRYPCLNILAQGCVVVSSSSDDVAPGTLIEEGAVWVSLPNTKRAVVALEDSVWVTAHMNPTNTTDLGVLEALLIQPDVELLA